MRKNQNIKALNADFRQKFHMRRKRNKTKPGREKMLGRNNKRT